jgi:hypothetical protein
MRLENVKAGETYMLKVGKNPVQVTVTGVDEKGKITVTTAGGKTLTVADAGRLAVHREGRASAPDTNAPQAAKGAKTKVAAPKATKTASGRNVGQKGAPQAKEKRVGLVDAAILVLHEAGNKPMNVKEIIEVVLAKKLWSTSGKTPAATLYSSILREIQKKGSDARFKKVDRGQFALVG